MDEARELLGERLLRDARLGIGLHLRLERRDLVERTEREHLQVTDHVGVGRAEEVLVPVVDARHLRVQEERVALALAELLARRVEEQREREAVGRLAAHAVHEVGAGRDVAPLRWRKSLPWRIW